MIMIIRYGPKTFEVQLKNGIIYKRPDIYTLRIYDNGDIDLIHIPEFKPIRILKKDIYNIKIEY